jgi:hypothetical protein
MAACGDYSSTENASLLYHGVFAEERVRSPDSNRNPRKEVQSEAWCQVSQGDPTEVSKSTRKAKMEEAVEKRWA